MKLITPFILLIIISLLFTSIHSKSTENNNDKDAKDSKNDDEIKIDPTTTINGFRPPMNAIPELYPEKYPGLTMEQAPHDVPIPLNFNWCAAHQCSPNLQQHITYTPLCFLHASIHMLNDRINYEIEKENLGVPAIYLSRQDYLDFAHLSGYGDKPLEEGGEGVDVMEYARQYGIPDETCNPWQSDGQNHQNNDILQRCRNCMMLYNDKIQHCWNIEKYVKYYVSEYGFLKGEKAMMNEIFHRGPIQCGVVVDDEMIYNYAGGIYKDYGRLANAVVDHDVEVVGWGEAVDHKTKQLTPYWLVRNSWGSNIWGTNGFFLVFRGNNTMRIEERCMFAQPDIRELKAHLHGDNVGTMFGLINPKEEKPRLKPINWDSEPHDFSSPSEIADEQIEQDKLDQWTNTYINTPLAQERLAKANEDIIIGAPKSIQTSVFEWVFGITGIICIGLILAVIGAIWLYFSQNSNDGYQPIPHADL